MRTVCTYQFYLNLLSTTIPFIQNCFFIFTHAPRWQQNQRSEFRQNKPSTKKTQMESIFFWVKIGYSCYRLILKQVCIHLNQWSLVLYLWPLGYYNVVPHWHWPPKTEVRRLFSKFFTANILFWEYLGVVCFRPKNQPFL